MAYSDGNDYPLDASGDMKRLGILAFSCALVAVLLVLYPGAGWGPGPAALLGTFVCASMSAAYFKMHPLSWMRMFRKDEYARFLAADGRIRGALSSLDDTHFILANIVVELFHVEYLVVSRGGIFVIAAARGNRVPGCTGGVLHAGGRSLGRTTSALWRTCHFLNILVRKSYKTEVMPQPFLVFPDLEDVPLGEFDGITIVTLDGLLPAIRRAGSAGLPGEICDSVAYYLKSRCVGPGSAGKFPAQHHRS
jgi:hypothetical protein